MTVKDLIIKLLNYDMNAKVEVLTNVKDDEICSYSVVNVRDGQVYQTGDNKYHIFLYTYSGKKMKNIYKNLGWCPEDDSYQKNNNCSTHRTNCSLHFS